MSHSTHFGFRYTLLIGKPPFATATLRDTVYKIKRADYDRPSPDKVCASARALLTEILQVDPALRPSTKQILASEFFSNGKKSIALDSAILLMRIL
jgi:serine/threonine protein kinase